MLFQNLNSKFINLKHSHKNRDGGQGVEWEFCQRGDHDGRVLKLSVFWGDENEEDDHGDDGQDHYKDPNEQPRVGACAIDSVVVGWSVENSKVFNFVFGF